MASETELKLALPPNAQRALLRHALLRQADRKSVETLVNIYYDTPDLKLHQRGIALRLRRQGRTWLQTVKCAGSRSGGLSVRPEWETPYGGRFDFSAVDAPPVRAFLEKRSIRERLVPVFETNFRRNTWHFEGLLLALDRGWIAAGGRRLPISELELELAGGNTEQLFSLAEQLAARLPLAPAVRSKAERGYLLFLDVPSVPVRAGQARLSARHFARLSPLSAFCEIAADCLDHLQHNHEGAIDNDDPEFIHQMRVATRRLRAAIRLFSPLLPEALAGGLAPALRELMATLGQVRDLDVLLHEVKAPVLRAMPGDPHLAELGRIMASQREAARQTARRHLASPAYGQLLLRILALLHQPPLAGPTPTGSLSLIDFARDRLQGLRRKVRRLARSARADQPESLHALRIATKRLRYALEFFAALPGGKRRSRLAARLAEVQGIFGQINDLANAGHLLGQAAGSRAALKAAVDLVQQWHQDRHDRLLEQVPPLLGKLARLPDVV
jgi:inorganic triphosphatase YgiF